MATIEQIYAEELGRAADASGLAFYQGLLNSGTSINDIRAQIDASAEGRAYENSIATMSHTGYGSPTTSTSTSSSSSGGGSSYTPTTTTASSNTTNWADPSASDYGNIGKWTLNDLYIAELGRQMDESGQAFYQNMINQGATVDEIRAALNASAEGVAYDQAAEGKAINPITGKIIEGTPEEYAQYIEKFGTGSIVTDGLSGYMRDLYGDTPNSTNGMLAFYAQPEQIAYQQARAAERAAAANTAMAANYGNYGKNPDESLTDYYSRLSSERQGGILGQGLMSSAPTPGSEAYNAQAVSDIMGDYFASFGSGSLTDNRSTSDEFGDASGNMSLEDAYRVYGEGFTTPEEFMFAIANKVFPGSGLFAEYAIESEADRAVMNDLINQGYQPGGTSSNENMFSGNDPSSKTDISAGADQYD